MFIQLFLFTLCSNLSFGFLFNGGYGGSGDVDRHSSSIVRLMVSQNNDVVPPLTSMQSTRKLMNDRENNISMKKKQPLTWSSRLVAVRALLQQQQRPSNKKKGTTSTTNKKSNTMFAIDRLENSAKYKSLSARDRSFCRLLVTTVERRKGQIDAIIDICQKKNKKNNKNRVDQIVEIVLQIGIAQLLFLNTPPHAAVKETIDVLRNQRKIDAYIPESKIKFVNAVLRRVAKDGQQLLADHTSIELNASPWLVQEWKNTWGGQITQNILQSSMVETPRCITVNLQNIYREYDDTNYDKVTLDRKVQQYIESIADHFDKSSEILPNHSIRIINPPSGPITNWPLYNDGIWWCQDISATLPVIALYQSLSVGGTKSVHDMHVVDLCASPGGKTAQLSNYNFNSVTAIEISKRRTIRLRQNMERLHMNWNIIIADASQWMPSSSSSTVDAVLVDVPCTATGTGSKRPDVLRRNSNISELLQIQEKLIRHASTNIVKVGGIIIYATCSLLKQESEDQINKLLNTPPDGITIKTIPFQPGEIPGFDNAIDDNGWLRVLPGTLPGSLSQCDGFFVARLQRIS